MFSIFIKKDKSVEQALNNVELAASNNYKDEAQKAYKNFCDELDKALCENRINEKSYSYYSEIRKKLEKDMSGFRH